MKVNSRIFSLVSVTKEIPSGRTDLRFLELFPSTAKKRLTQANDFTVVHSAPTINFGNV